jgi:hypothetical protein
MASVSSSVSVASLGTPTKSGYLTKQGRKFKTWRRRWFVLKNDALWYFKTPTDGDKKGVIYLEPTSICKIEQDLKKKSKEKITFFSVSTSIRKCLIYADDESEAKVWIKLINQAIEEKKRGSSIQMIQDQLKNNFKRKKND